MIYSKDKEAITKAVGITGIFASFELFDMKIRPSTTKIISGRTRSVDIRRQNEGIPVCK